MYFLSVGMNGSPLILAWCKVSSKNSNNPSLHTVKQFVDVIKIIENDSKSWIAK